MDDLQKPVIPPPAAHPPRTPSKPPVRRPAIGARNPDGNVKAPLSAGEKSWALFGASSGFGAGLILGVILGVILGAVFSDPPANRARLPKTDLPEMTPEVRKLVCAAWDGKEFGETLRMYEDIAARSTGEKRELFARQVRESEAGLREARDAIATLKAMGPEAKAAIPYLVQQAIRDGGGCEAFGALLEIGPAESVPYLVDAVLADNDAEKRFLAAEHLGDLGEHAEAAIPALELSLARAADAVTYDDELAASKAAGALGRMGPAGMAALIRAMGHEDVEVRRNAVYVEPWEGDGKLAIPALIEALVDEDKTVRFCAARSLGNLEAGEALPPLKEALRKETDAGAALMMAGAIDQLTK